MISVWFVVTLLGKNVVGQFQNCKFLVYHQKRNVRRFEMAFDDVRVLSPVICSRLTLDRMLLAD